MGSFLLKWDIECTIGVLDCGFTCIQSNDCGGINRIFLFLIFGWVLNIKKILSWSISPIADLTIIIIVYSCRAHQLSKQARGPTRVDSSFYSSVYGVLEVVFSCLSLFKGEVLMCYSTIHYIPSNLHVSSIPPAYSV